MLCCTFCSSPSNSLLTGPWQPWRLISQSLRVFFASCTLCQGHRFHYSSGILQDITFCHCYLVCQKQHQISKINNSSFPMVLLNDEQFCSMWCLLGCWDARNTQHAPVTGLMPGCPEHPACPSHRAALGPLLWPGVHSELLAEASQCPRGSSGWLPTELASQRKLQVTGSESLHHLRFYTLEIILAPRPLTGS